MASVTSKKMGKKTAQVKQSKFVFEFGTKTDGNATMRELLGGKGANLAEMASIGLPVPPGFTISTEVLIVNPGGTGSPMEAISARFAPLPPSNSRIVAFPSVLVPNSKTNLLCST